MKNNYCLIKSSENFKEFLQKELFFSRAQIKKIIPKKLQEKEYQSRDEVYLPIDLINNHLINPSYSGKEIQVVYEDDFFLVLNKPEFIHGHPLNYSETDTVLNFLRSRFSLPNLSDHPDKEKGLLYRLDEGTSGVLIYIKNNELHEELRKKFSDLVKTKKYLAIVQGNFTCTGIHQHTLQGQGKKGSRVSEDENGIDCLGHYKRLRYDSDRDISVVEIDLQTGFRHQIRAQLSLLGHPIIGDTLYGGCKEKRIYLHAYNYALKFKDQDYSWYAEENKLFCDFLNLNSLTEVFR